MTKLWHSLRALVFYIGYVLTLIGYSLFCLLVIAWVPYRKRHPYIVAFNRFYLWWLRWTCGVRYRLEGVEHLPMEGAFVMISNHQSEWETFFLQTLPRPLVTVLKKELLSVPFFGWALRLLRPIAIDRSQKTNALKQILRQGKERLEAGEGLLIFPEGTRLDPGAEGSFSKGGASLACMAKVPLLPVVHNAGEHWPNKRFLKVPGEIVVRIGAPISTEGRKVDEVHEQAVGWITQHMKGSR
ncbi:lysophospholipid acyltransferase family protein [Balneatrix alpica]|uniref:Lysophospholipid acyltransferase family protein n=1 Tax=Balneatrix alpica TaxID=75684 RepID=A0ABV5ZBG2_9GAMM|nr:lysophospholipid acyltransferase family protein [Balneatrix alpica]